MIALGSELLVYQAASCFFLSFNFVFFRSLQGAGDVIVPMGMSIANAIFVTLALGLWLADYRGMGPTGIFIANLAGAASSTLFMGAWIATGRWTRARDAMSLPVRVNDRSAAPGS